MQDVTLSLKMSHVRHIRHHHRPHSEQCLNSRNRNNGKEQQHLFRHQLRNLVERERDAVSQFLLNLPLLNFDVLAEESLSGSSAAYRPSCRRRTRAQSP